MKKLCYVTTIPLTLKTFVLRAQRLVMMLVSALAATSKSTLVFATIVLFAGVI